MKVVQVDVLEADLGALSLEALGGAPFHIAANLPYYITTPILAKVLESGLPFRRMVALVQWEVGRRLAAGPGGKEYGALSVMAQFRAKVSLLRKVLPGAFTPVPRVDSALVLFERLAEPLVKVRDPDLFFKVVRSAFGKRRKTLSNALKMAGFAVPTGAWERAGVKPGQRAEELGLAQFAVLADSFLG